MRIKLLKDIPGHKKGDILSQENTNKNGYLLTLLLNNGYAERVEFKRRKNYEQSREN